MFTQLKALKTKKGRDEQGLFIVEGEKFVAEIPQDWRIRHYLCSESYLNSAMGNSAKAAKFKRAPLITVSDSRFASLSDTKSPQGLMAICEKRTFSISELLAETEEAKPFLLIGECLSDPGNIGTLIRTAAAAGAGAVILSAGSGDVYNPKTIRSAAGASLRIPVIEGADLNEVIPLLKQRGLLILAAQLQAAVLPYDLDLSQSLAILIGNEAHGLSDELSRLADVAVKLPMAQGIESLNASVAGGVLLYEVIRQRL